MSSTIAVAVAAAKTTTGNQDITTTDLGGATPVACCFLYARGSSDGVIVNNSGHSNGYTDGTNQVAYAWYGSASPAGGACIGSATSCIVALNSVTGTVHSKASVVGFIANGVTVNWTTASSDGFLVTALFFAGTDWTAQVGTSHVYEVPSTAAKVTLGWQPDIVMLSNCGNYLSDDSIRTNIVLNSIGWAAFTPTGLNLSQSEDSLFLSSNLRTNACGSSRSNLLFCQQVSDGFYLQNTSSTPSQMWGYLALKYTGVGFLKTGLFDITKDTAGDYAVTGLGGKPGGFLWLMMEQHTGSMGSQWSFGNTICTLSPSKTGGYSISGGTYNIYAQPTTPLFDKELACEDSITMMEGVGALSNYGQVNFIGTLKTFDSNGFTLNFTNPPDFHPELSSALAKWTWGYLTIVNYGSVSSTPRKVFAWVSD